MLNLKYLDTMYSLPSRIEPSGSGLQGLYYLDTRQLSHYEWIVPGALLLSEAQPTGSSLEQVYSSPERHRGDFAILRRLRLERAGFLDRIELKNYGTQPRAFELRLVFEADFRDLMELRLSRGLRPTIEALGPAHWRSRSADGIELETELSFSPEPGSLDRGEASWAFSLGPGEAVFLRVHGRFSSAAAPPPPDKPCPLLDPEVFRSRFAELLEEETPFRPVLERAVADLHELLHEEKGLLVLAAGLPAFDTPFGRDSLIAAGFLLERLPELAEGCLRLAAELQGRESLAERLEEPGKIYHEIRRGELSRLGLIPFARYYGSVDATPLFILLLGRHCRFLGRSALAEELREALIGALGWILRKLEEGGGFLRFSADPGPSGLKVQSWKDSRDSLCLPDGSLASGEIAVSEVQAYAYGALREGGALAELLGDAELARRCEGAAAKLARDIRAVFWLPEESVYALALDGAGRILPALASNAGHFLEFGLESPEEAARLAARLLEKDLFSGWGIRTLGCGEARFNPLSYHNGSVWPHDNAIIATGLVARGLRAEALRVAEAQLEAVSRLELQRAPELLAGFSREELEAPVAHPYACSPQAWSAAGIIRMAEIRRACRGAERALESPQPRRKA